MFANGLNDLPVTLKMPVFIGKEKSQTIITQNYFVRADLKITQRYLNSEQVVRRFFLPAKFSLLPVALRAGEAD
jgi:hypothetical protein